MALECTMAALTNLDQTDPDAVQALLHSCIGTLLNPTLWAWALGITVAGGVVGLLIGLVKGRWLAGLAWGAALGPIGWIIVALSKSHFVECPDCGRPNAPAAKACRHCGVNLVAAARRSARATVRRNDSGRGW